MRTAAFGRPCGKTLTRLAALGTLSRGAGEGGTKPGGLGGATIRANAATRQKG